MQQCKEPTSISKQNALGLIHLYNKRAAMIAKLIRSFIPPEDLEGKPFDEENLIVSFGLYNLNSEDAWEHIDTTPTSVVTALEVLITFKQMLIKMKMMVWILIQFKVIMKSMMVMMD
eukprot:scaffold8843_cov76-Cyclotella_meneghiniana.AAC.2